MGFLNKILIVALFFIPSYAYATDYYIANAPTGNDANTGLIGHPVETITRVLAVSSGGDTIYFDRDSTWSVVTDSAILTCEAGTDASHPTIYDGSTWEADGGSTSTKATFTTGETLSALVKIYVSNVTLKGFDLNGDSQITSGIRCGSSAATSISNIDIDNCKVHDLGGIGAGQYGIHVGPISYADVTVSDVLVRNCTVYNVPYEGIAIYTSWGKSGVMTEDITVRNCTVYNTGQVDYAVGIYVANRTNNVTVEYNNVYNNVKGSGSAWGSGISVGTSEQYNGDPTNINVRYNLLYQNDLGISLGDTKGTIAASVNVYGNLIYNNNSKGISVGWTAGDVTAKILNNTVYSTVNYPVVIRLNTGCSLEFKNNIIMTSAATLIYFMDVGTEALISHSNNLLYSSNINTSQWILKEDSTYYNKTQISTWDSTTKATDPTFTGGSLPTGFSGTYGTDMVPNTNYFAISTGDALNNGAVLGSPYNGSINGAGLTVPLKRGVQYDIGAYEYSYINAAVTNGCWNTITGSVNFGSGAAEFGDCGCEAWIMSRIIP
jgi:hypothetical protein